MTDNPYQPPQPKTVSGSSTTPGLGTILLAAAFSLVAGALVFLGTCFGGGIVLFSASGPDRGGLYLFPLLYAVTGAVGLYVTFVVFRRIYSAKKNELLEAAKTPSEAFVEGVETEPRAES